MVKMVVVFHSGYGHTQRLAQFVAQGAQASLVEINEDGLVSDEGWEMLDQAQGIIFGSPTYMGVVSWQFKRFADSSSKQWYSRGWQDKVAGGFTISANLSGDKLSTLQYLMTLAMQHGMVWVGQSSHSEGGLNRLGSYSGVMAQVGSTQSASEIPVGDLETAQAYGQRLLQLTQSLHAKS